MHAHHPDPFMPSLGELAALAAEAHQAREKANRAALVAEERYVRAAAAATESGDLEWHELLDVYDQTRVWAYPGWPARWRDTVGMTHHEVRRYADTMPALRRTPVEYGARTWVVTRDDDTEAWPPPGQYVVYFLHGDAGELLYVGTSSDAAHRLTQHHRKPWASATLREVHGRTAAEGLEAVEMLTHRPPLNEQLQRSGGPGVLLVALRRAGLLTVDLDSAAKSIEAELQARWKA